MGKLCITEHHYLSSFKHIQIQDDDIPNSEEPHRDKKEQDRLDDLRVPAEGLSSVAANHSDDAPMQDKEVQVLLLF